MEISPFFIIALLLFCSLFASRLSKRLGIPALLLFLGIGMLAGSDGPGNIDFDDAEMTNHLGTIALAFILFSGGFDTRWKNIKPIINRGVLLATIGVILTALLVAGFVYYVLKMPFGSAMLIGAIISSTDAAAVFSILRCGGIGLKGNLSPLLELESGSNDPMAIFLTVSTLQMVMHPDQASLSVLLLKFAVQMLVGLVIGAGIGQLGIIILNRTKLEYEGLYSVFGIAMVFLCYGTTDIFFGNGFLAAYVCGIVMGNSNYMYKKAIGRSLDSMAWFMQITMFLVLGLLVFPSRLPIVAWKGLAVAFFLMFVARPVAVFICTVRSSFSFREKLLIGWSGLRGAAPIILATFPLMHNYKDAGLMFNLVFFIVLTSVLIQGKTLMTVAKWLKVDQPLEVQPLSPLEFIPESGTSNISDEFEIDPGYAIIGKTVSELNIPDNTKIMLIRRKKNYITPRGNTVVAANDTFVLYGPPEEVAIFKDEVCSNLMND